MIVFHGKIFSDKKVATLLSAFAGMFILITAYIAPDMYGYRLSALILFIAAPFLGFFAMRIAELMGTKRPAILRIAKFSLIGGVSTLLEVLILNILFDITHVVSGPYYSLFKTITFLVALLNSYVWNRHWTFEQENAMNKKEFGIFFLVNVVGLLINVGVASFVVNTIGAPASVSPYLWANVGVFAAVFFTMTWNYFSYAIFVFKK